MSSLCTTSNIAHPDDVYQLLIDLHAGFDDAESALVNAKLVMIMANHIGDEAVIREAVSLARKKPSGSGPTAAPWPAKSHGRHPPFVVAGPADV